MPSGATKAGHFVNTLATHAQPSGASKAGPTGGIRWWSGLLEDNVGNAEVAREQFAVEGGAEAKASLVGRPDTGM